MKKTKTAFMCKTEFNHELGNCADKVRVYNNIADMPKCIQECGVYKVSISIIKDEINGKF